MAREFRDSAGRTWRIVVSVPTVKRVREQAGVDLFDIAGDVFGRLSADPVLFVDTIYALVRPQADTAGVSDVEFGEAMAGAPLVAAADALAEAIADFYEGRPASAAIRQAAAATRTAEATATDAIMKMNLAELAQHEALEVIRKVDQFERDVAMMEIRRVAESGAPSTDAPASSA